MSATGRGAGHAKVVVEMACVMWAAVQGHARRVERPAPGKPRHVGHGSVGVDKRLSAVE